jgi:hypothetical protein
MSMKRSHLQKKYYMIHFLIIGCKEYIFHFIHKFKWSIIHIEDYVKHKYANIK